MNKKHKKILIIVFLAVLIIAGCFVLFQKPEPAEAGWWDDTWLYRKPVAITNASTAETDFQVQITLDTATLITANTMQADCDDIRLTDINSNIIPHWMEPGTCNGASTKIWAKVPSIPASNATVYIYYGNPSAASESSVSDTFIREIAGVQGAWDMDGTGAIATNDTTADFSGNGNTGTASNVDTLGMAYASSQFAQGIDFDGTDDYVNAGAGATLNITDAITIEAWAKADLPLAGIQAIAAKDKSGDRHFLAYLTADGRQDFLGGGADSVDQSTSAITSGVWNHIVYVYKSGEYVKYFLNGVANGEDTTVSVMTSANTNLYIGAREYVGSNMNFNGSIDGVRIYNAALTQPEITDLYGTGGDRQGYVTTNYPNKSLVRKYSASVTIGSPGTEEKGPGPAGYWSFDEGYGDTTYDATDNGNDGTRGGGDAAKKPTWQDESMCVSGKCLSFDGDNDYVDCGAGDSLDITDAITISAWVKPTAIIVTDAKYIVGKGSNTTTDFAYGFGAYSDSQKLFWKIRSNGSNKFCDANSVIVLNEWYHLVGIYDGSIMKLYINGILQTDTESFDTGIDSKTDKNLTLGELESGQNREFNGFIDEVRIYPYARSAEQIHKDYNAGLAGMGGGTEGVGVALGGGGSQKWMTDGLVGYWKMDESLWDGTAGEVVDASGAGNHGVRAGNATTAAGKFGKGGTFDGTGDYVDVGDMTETSAQTVALWVKPDAVNVTEEVLDFNGTQYVKIASGIVTGEGFTSPTVYVDGSVATTITANWHHIVITTDTGFSASDVDIGRLESSTEFDGSIDQVRIYNRALSPKEVRDLYNFAPGPVLHLKMDDPSTGSGQEKVDTSTYGNHGTTSSVNGAGMDCTVPGKFGAACEFDGTDDYVDCGTDSSLDNVQTIEMWIKPGITYDSSLAENDYFFGKRSVSLEDRMGLGIKAGDGRIFFWSEEHNNGDNIIYSTIDTWTAGTWYYIVATWDTTNGKRLYVNGVMEDDDSAETTLLVEETISLYLGAFDVNYFFNGSIDDVRIYNYARTQKQIIQDMNAGHPAVGSPVGSQVGYWKFDEGYGDTANDSSPQNNDGNLAGTCPGAATCPSWTNSGKFGKALSFDGGDYVDCGSGASLDITDAITISAWVKPDNIADNGYIVAKRDGNNQQYGVHMNSSGEIVFYSFGADHSFNTATAMTQGEWNHIVTVWDGSSGKVYYGGVDVTDDSAMTAITTATSNVSIGARGDGAGGWSGYFNGTIDEVKIYNYALTEDEVRVEYNQGKAIVLGATGTETDGTTPSFSADREYCIPGDTTSCDPPVAEWNFNEQTGSSAYDTSNNNNTGTITNATWTPSGKYGSALSFDGDGDYVDCGSHSSLNITDAITIEAWVKFNFYDQPKLIVCRGSSIVDGYYFLTRDNHRLGFKVNQSNASQEQFTVSNAFVTDVWQHLVVTKNGSEAKIYVNGVDKTGTPVSLTNPDSSTRNFYIGRYDSETLFFNGSIDGVKIYDYARTAAQVAWSYNRGGPVAEWRFDECQGNTAHDESGNGNTGTITIGANAPQTSVGTCTDGLSTSAWYNGVDGKINSALSLDGVDDYVDCGNDSSLNIGQQDYFTIEMWVYKNAQASKKMLFWRGHDTGWSRWTLWRNGGANDSLELYLLDADSNDEVADTSAITDNAWHHIVFTGSVEGSISSYVDGVLKNTDSSPGISKFTNTDSLYIGGRWTGSIDNNFNGSIDEVKIYNYALTPLQVKTEYNSGAINFR